MKISLVAACAVIVAVASLSVGSAGAARSSVIDCKRLTGARWHLAGQTGTHYDAAAQGVGCAFVRTWVARLEGPPHPDGTLRGGPAGWTCIAANRYFLRCQDAGNTKAFTIRPA